MVMINIPENLAKVIEKAAQRENRSLDELALSVLEEHFPVEAAEETPDASNDVNPLDSILGILDYDVTDMSSGKSGMPSEGVSALDALMGLFDDDVTDMSTTVKETMREYYKNKTWKSDDM